MIIVKYVKEKIFGIKIKLNKNNFYIKIIYMMINTLV